MGKRLTLIRVRGGDRRAKLYLKPPDARPIGRVSDDSCRSWPDDGFGQGLTRSTVKELLSRGTLVRN